MNNITNQLKSYIGKYGWDRLIEVCKESDTNYTPIEIIDYNMFKMLAKFCDDNNLDYSNFIASIVPDIRKLY